MRVIAVTLLLAFSFSGFSEDRTTWDGFVTDTHCGTNCQRTSAMTPDPACVHRCVKQGSKYGFWVDSRVYVLEPQAKAAKFAAENVRVTGTILNDTIHIVSITPVPQTKQQTRQ